MGNLNQSKEELDAVLHWRCKHAQAIRERDALQLRLNAADQRIDELTPRDSEHPEGKRERFEKWVMTTKHGVFGFLDGQSLARSDDRTGYAEEYVQGLWVAFNAFGAQHHGEPVAVLPDNLLSHRNTWLQAMERLVELEPESGAPDEDEKGFWRHELKAMHDMYSDLDRLTTK